MRFLIVCSVFIVMSVEARAQQRPLATEDPETVGAGRVLVEGGFDYGRDVLFPASGLNGNLLRAPLVGVSVGLSSLAELQIDGGLYNRLSITGRREAPLAPMVTAAGDSTADVEDIVVATKIRFTTEGSSRPALGMRFATRLPNAGNESGLGLDTTDFFVTFLGAKTVESVRFVGNLGLGILGDPTRGDRQNDVLMYGVSFARAVTNAAEIVGEVNGRAHVSGGTAPVGTESRGAFRFGGRYTQGLVRLDAAVSVGLTSRDAGIGVSAGFTWVFSAFQVP
jgi:hypothetical protein